MLALDPRVVEAVWTAVQSRLPPRPPDTHPLGCHRPRIPDRDCFQGILVRLVTGCSWEVAARLTPASEATLRNRRTEWLAAGVFEKVLEEAIDGYDRIIGLDLSEVAVDGSLHKAPCGGEGTGPNPTDRAKSGWKWSVATDRVGIPIGWVIEGANRNDSVLLEPTLQAVADRGLPLDVETLHLDRGYDSALTTQRCHALGVTDIVCAKKRTKGTAKAKKPLSLGLRWPVERTNSWLSNFGQLRRNTDRHPKQRLAQIALVVTLILTVKLVKWAGGSGLSSAVRRRNQPLTIEVDELRADLERGAGAVETVHTMVTASSARDAIETSAYPYASVDTPLTGPLRLVQGL